MTELAQATMCVSCGLRYFIFFLPVLFFFFSYIFGKQHLAADNISCPGGLGDRLWESIWKWHSNDDPSSDETLIVAVWTPPPSFTDAVVWNLLMLWGAVWWCFVSCNVSAPRHWKLTGCGASHKCSRPENTNKVLKIYCPSKKLHISEPKSPADADS